MRPTAASFRSCLLTALLGLLLLATAPAHGQDLFYDAYQRGQAAFEAGDLPLARRMFERALQLDSRQSRQKRFAGMTFRPYFPEFYLARIDVRERRYEQGIASFDRIERSGLIKAGDPEFTTLTADRSTAVREQRTLALAAAPATPGQPIVTTTTPPASAPTQPPSTTAATASTGDRQPPGAVSAPSQPPATTARAAAPTPPPTPPAVTSPSASATPIPGGAVRSAEVTRLTTELARRIDARDYPRASTTLGSIRSLPGGAEASRSEAARMQAAMARDAGRLLQENKAAEAGALVRLLGEVAPAAPETAQLQRRLRELVAMVEAERDTFATLLRGDYQKVVQLTANGARQTGRLLFYGACGRAALSLTTAGEERTRLASDARALFQRAAGLGAPFGRDERYISPAILAVLRER